MIATKPHPTEILDVSEPDILRPSEIRELSGATRGIVECLVASGAVRPAVRGRKRVEHLFDLRGLAAIVVYLWLRNLNIEASVCQQAARRVQEASSEIKSSIEFGRTFLLILPTGVSEATCTRDEAKAALSSLADGDLGRAVVLNLLPIWNQVAERVRAVMDSRKNPKE